MRLLFNRDKRDKLLKATSRATKFTRLVSSVYKTHTRLSGVGDDEFSASRYRVKLIDVDRRKIVCCCYRPIR